MSPALSGRSSPSPRPISRVSQSIGASMTTTSKSVFSPFVRAASTTLLLGGMEKAVTRIIESASRRGERSRLRRYDVDGTNGAAMLYLFLKSRSVVEYYIPDGSRKDTGSPSGDRPGQGGRRQNLPRRGCGITAVEQVEYARNLAWTSSSAITTRQDPSSLPDTPSSTPLPQRPLPRSESLRPAASGSSSSRDWPGRLGREKRRRQISRFCDTGEHC